MPARSYEQSRDGNIHKLQPYRLTGFSKFLSSFACSVTGLASGDEAPAAHLRDASLQPAVETLQLLWNNICSRTTAPESANDAAGVDCKSPSEEPTPSPQRLARFASAKILNAAET
eukprot:353367-Chlamydomonas_euryale.AAC.5